MTNSAYLEIHNSTLTVQVGNDQELKQWEKIPISKTEVGENRS